MTTFTVQVNASAGDAHEIQNDTGFSDTALFVICNSNTAAGSRYKGGFVFENVTIPSGADVTSAYLTVYAQNALNDDPNVDIYGNAVVNARDFVETADVQNRTLTANSVQWTATGIGTGATNTPDITSVIQEILDNPDWESGNALCVIFVGKSDVNTSCRFESYDNTPAEAASLTVVYTAPPSVQTYVEARVPYPSNVYPTS